MKHPHSFVPTSGYLATSNPSLGAPSSDVDVMHARQVFVQFPMHVIAAMRARYILFHQDDSAVPKKEVVLRLRQKS